MNSFLLYKITLGIFAACAALLACAVSRISPANLPKLEPLPRNRVLGLATSLAALLWCVPHTRPIAFDWMQDLLLPAAVVLPILGYFLLDYLAARGIAGLMILFAYYFVHGAFEYHSAGALAITVLAWLLGIGGIAVSAKPCYLRDTLRLLAAKRAWRIGASLYFACAALALAFALVQHLR